MFPTRRILAVATAVAAFVLSGCDDNNVTGVPTPIVGVTVTPQSNSAVQITFTSVAGDNSYDIERAEGAAGAFVAVTTITAPGTASVVTYNDLGLTLGTTYRYRVFSNRGGARSSASSVVSATTLAKAATISTDIGASRTLYADTVYTLSGFIHVGNGAVLTIQPGTKILGDFNVLGSCLIIMKGAQIQAVGTAVAPIVFTSSRPVGQRQPGDWGGLIIIGNAINNRTGAAVTLEGSGTDGVTVVGGKNYSVVYNGGATATDNSGTLSYVRVEFAGYAPLQDQEFNSFTFAAVGSTTRASYLQALAGLDDSYEFFGGGFDIDHLVALETGDDMFDMSESWSGRMQYLIGINTLQIPPRLGGGFYSVDVEGIENDGCNGTGCTSGFNTTPYTIPLVANFTLIGCGHTSCMGTGGGHGMMLRRGTGGYYVNGVVARWTADAISLRDPETYVRAGSTATPANTADLQIRNVLAAETNNLLFQAASATQNVLDPTANTLTLSVATAATLFTAIPAVSATPAGLASFDFTPIAASAITAGGMSTFSGAIATKAGTFVTGTTYLGAVAPAGPKWWEGWTNYARN